MGAYAAHGLRSVLAAAELATVQTAVQYQMWHALVLLLAGGLSGKQRAWQHSKLRCITGCASTGAGWCWRTCHLDAQGGWPFFFCDRYFRIFRQPLYTGFYRIASRSDDSVRRAAADGRLADFAIGGPGPQARKPTLN